MTSPKGLASRPPRRDSSLTGQEGLLSQKDDVEELNQA
ncbi:MAG: hypothetical protein RLZZ535_2129 [Cyanobacteriota bacterium]|jgi:hypothetical protein